MAIQQKVTPEAFEAFVELAENEDRLFELISGEIFEKVPTNAYASFITQVIAFFIQKFMREQRIEGFITAADGGFMVDGDRYAPDIAFLSIEQGVALARKGYNNIPPELAVEVETNITAATERRLRAKVLGYLNAGVLLWIVYPETQEIEVYAPGQSIQKLGINDTLTGGDVLPGFELPLKEVFIDHV